MAELRKKVTNKNRTSRAALKLLALDALAKAPNPLTLNELVKAIGGTNDTSVRHALRELIEEGKVSYRVEERQSRGTAWVLPAGKLYATTVYFLPGETGGVS